MGTDIETNSEVKQVDKRARAWIKANSLKLNSMWNGGHSDGDMTTAYRAGFAAGLDHARKVEPGSPRQ